MDESLTRPTQWEKSYVYTGVVNGHTRMLFGRIASKSAAEKMTLTRAVTVPGLMAVPVNTLVSYSCRLRTTAASNSAIDSRSIPVARRVRSWAKYLAW